MNSDEYWRLDALSGSDDRLFELIEGEMIELPPLTHDLGEIQMNVLSAIFDYNKTHNLGHVVAGRMPFTLTPYNVRVPDGAFLSNKRYPNATGRADNGADLTIEIFAPHETAGYIQTKVDTFLKAGTEIIWCIAPEEKFVVVYYQVNTETMVKFLQITDTLDGGEVLPGFSLDMRKIFE